MNLTLADVRDVLHQATFDRGQEYVRQRRVLAVEQDGDVLNATVQGSGSNVYQQEITLSVFRDAPDIDSVCSCPVGSNCKHVAAALIEYLQRPSSDQITIATGRLRAPEPAVVVAKPVAKVVLPPSPPLARPMEAWLTRVQSEIAGAVSAVPQTGLRQKVATHQVVFVLSAAYNGKKAVLHLCKAQPRPNGQFLSAQPITDVPRLLADPTLFLRSEDRDLIGLFVAQNDGNHAQHAACELSGELGAQLLRALLQQQRLLWANSLSDLAKGTAYPLQLAAPRRASLTWHEAPDDGRDAALDLWQLGWQFEAETDGAEPSATLRKSLDYMLPTEPPWYIDNLSCGELLLSHRDNRITNKALNDLVIQAPMLDPENRLTVAQQLLTQGLSDVIPFPPQVAQAVRRDIAPQPLLVLGNLPSVSNPLMQDFAELHFRYDGAIASARFSTALCRNTPAGIEQIMRDQAAEATLQRTLQELGLQALEGTQHPLAMMPGMFMLPDQSAWLRFAKVGVPQLIAQGWQIDKRAEYRFDVAEVEDWYAEIDDAADDAGGSSFDLQMGIVVNHQRISLLPLLVDLIRHAPQDFDPRTMALRDDQDELLVRLADGMHVAMPWGRIKPILNTLGELYFAEKTEGPVRLSALDAARLAELDAGNKLRWVGGDRLRSMGQKLHTFGGIRQVLAPPRLQATLRDYQLQGVAWMQFLREYDLAGILADDMGLGKTVQTLAHILIEKQSGRLTAPALVIAPTSLMDNWLQEAARFAPDLRVLVLQGKQRLEQFDQIAECDLILTTYALLPRDEERWREQVFHLLILDEAHYIKNPRSKVAQSAALLNARHRLCLTGTPVENHLGELWAQFHFLLPGLLGDEKTFNRDFRHPIEKQSDATRRALLSRRIKPFLLRRTKDKVAKELPPKTEMLRSVTLTGAQRDLYENVRLVMDKKVREEIAKKGVARSHIVILEALLKLRQACCDPRLLKTDQPEVEAAQAEMPSAKLQELLEMVDELRQEDRRILVFSQFTSMLALIADELRERDIGYTLLTGATQDRAEAVRKFQDGEVPVFLISLKAGGVGLNLTAADTVIHYDPWWNPAAESQATDRAWRIGQDKPVFVYKLIAKGTVEESIQLLQQKKADLAQAMLSPEGDEAQNIGLTQDDLQAIFAPLSE
ncbi:Superfamily II DNA/RNA helicase [Collimonas arenae]|uniref:Superfamily II DNA/RNA helicase n=1 Tax=Collimonas arenae TaxID=279058 RepID=A0A0A1FII5_9BURK|nr:DEAD/DEAH box helicase [Collimonas arenae]AIY43454.1 Superfamily II DNA/RNA helicase [Collimonas arenae]